MTTAIGTPTSIRLLNASYAVLDENYSLQKAARLLALGKAIVEEAVTGRYLRPGWAYPKVIRLVKYVRVSYAKLYGTPRISKRGVLMRDNHVCAYCGQAGHTVDHILPRSRGGGTSWMNLVAACQKCNGKKSDRTPEEAGMTLLVEPTVPRRLTAFHKG